MSTTAAYRQLLSDTLPTRIDTDDEYDRLHERFSALFQQPHRTKAEDKLYDLLSVLLQDYDQRNALPALPPEDDTPAERLQWLLEQSGRSPKDLVPVFGQRSHVNEALHGKRGISVAQAKKLGGMFHLKPGYFV